MPAVLLVNVRRVATELPEGAAPAGSPGTPDAIVDEVVQTHGGAAAQAAGDGRLFCFAQAAGAVACALAIQSRLADHNRKAGGAGGVLMRMGIHATAGASGAAPAYRVSDRELQVASLILRATPAGRIFLSREAHRRCRSAAVCAFIPLGAEYFSGLPDPVDVYEAWRIPKL